VRGLCEGEDDVEGCFCEGFKRFSCEGFSCRGGCGGVSMLSGEEVIGVYTMYI
jgi:hypothetical protein